MKGILREAGLTVSLALTALVASGHAAGLEAAHLPTSRGGDLDSISVPSAPVAVLQEPPRELAGVRLGEPPPAAFGDDLGLEGASDSFLGLTGELFLAVDPRGLVSHVILSVTGGTDEVEFDPWPWAEDVEAHLERVLGVPPAEAGDLLYDPVAWTGEDRTLEVWHRSGCCGDGAAEVILRTNDPARTCGPEDGFREWLHGLQAALEAGDAEAVARHFHFPFSDFRVHSTEWIRDDEPLMDFPDAESFVEAFPALAATTAFDGIRRTDLERDPHAAYCLPVEGYYLGMMNWPLLVDRLADGWRASALIFQS